MRRKVKNIVKCKHILDFNPKDLKLNILFHIFRKSLLILPYTYAVNKY